MTIEALTLPPRAKARLELANKVPKESSPLQGRTPAEISEIAKKAVPDNPELAELIELILLKFNAM